MRSLSFLACALAVAAPAASTAQDWSRARSVAVTLTSHSFQPDSLRLTAGQPVVLRLANPSDEDHDFSAPEFLREASLDPSNRSRVTGGRIRVRAGETVEFRLVPAAGRYRLRCSERYHSTLGARGEIVVV
jgi:uncharacterized cupredoxin-like copper-binding protein